MRTYDVIVVGARVAGSVTALLLARRGLDVLVVDRAHFPSDTLSTHQVQVPGVARLRRWGLLDALDAAGTPATPRVRFDTGNAVLCGSFPEYDGAAAVYSPRRTLLDALLLDAARAAGAEVWEGFAVTGLVRSPGPSGERVCGVSGRARGDGSAAEVRARLVIGADGKHSLVAREAGASAYREGPALSAACYTYWSGVELDGGEIHPRDRRAVGAWPTNDGLVMTYVAWPIAEFDALRADVEGNLLKTLDAAGDLGDRVRAGTRAERVRCTNDLPSRFRVPYGPGWALVGDAGLVMDPITGRGIADAFRDAELLAGAVATGLGGTDRELDRALAGYRRDRDRAALPMYRFTRMLARLEPMPAAMGEMFAAMATDPAETRRFLGVMTGVYPPSAVFSPPHMIRLIGPRRFLSLARAR